MDSKTCRCGIKVRNGSHTVTVVVCDIHRTASDEFRVRVWTVAKGFLFNSVKGDTGPEARDALIAHPSPFHHRKCICALNSYLDSVSKEPTQTVGVSLFVNGEGLPDKTQFEYAKPKPSSEADVQQRFNQAILEALKELRVQPSDSVVSSLSQSLSVSWLRHFREAVPSHPGKGPKFVAAVQELLPGDGLPAPMPDPNILCECGVKCEEDEVYCPNCGIRRQQEDDALPPLVSPIQGEPPQKKKRAEPVEPEEVADTTKRKRRASDARLVDDENPEDNKHQESGFKGIDPSAPTVREIKTPTTSPVLGSIRDIPPPSNSRPGTPMRTPVQAPQSSPRNLFSEFQLDDVVVTRHVRGTDMADDVKSSPVKYRVRAPEHKVATVDESLAGIADKLNESKYGEFLQQIKHLGIEFTTQHKLPRLVVIGSESAGKSSVLERIAMQPVFPRDRNLCTRCPIKLSLRRDPAATEMEPVILRCGKRLLAVPQEAVGDTVKAVMNEVVREINGSVHGIVTEELVIEMKKPNVPTLDLIDLPGIVAANLPDEPPDMMRQTRELVERYVKDPNTVVVAVVPATIKRVRDAQAMQIVQTHNAQARTIGVLTMADLVHDSFGPDPRWELRERLNGVAQDLVELPAGYVAVKSRDMREGLSIAEAAVQELEWFRTYLHEFDRTEKVSSVALIRQIDRFYTEHIREKWVPEALRGLNQRAGAIRDEAATLGPDPQEMGLEGLFNATVALAAVMDKTLSRLLTEQLKHFSGLLPLPLAEGNVPIVPSISRVRASRNNKQLFINQIDDQAFVDTILKVSKQMITGSFSNSVFNVRLARFETLRAVLESVGTDCVQEHIQSFRQVCAERARHTLPTMLEFVELVMEHLFLPFFDVLNYPPARLAEFLMSRDPTVNLLQETQEGRRRELKASLDRIQQACVVLKSL